MTTITIESEALTTLVTTVAAEAATAALARVGLLIQQPKAEAPAKRSAKPTRSATPKASTTSKTRSTKARRSAKPVSKAQHSRGRHIEVVFGIRADGSLTPNQQSRARQFFASHDVTFGPQPITMRSIVQGIRSVNAALRGANETTESYWAVWNGPKGIGRLTDEQARMLLRSSKA